MGHNERNDDMVEIVEKNHSDNDDNNNDKIHVYNIILWFCRFCVHISSTIFRIQFRLHERCDKKMAFA